MRILITGATGYLGSNMAACFSQAGHEVHGTRRPGSQSLHPSVTQAVTMRLGEPPNPETFRGLDLVIHAAHDFSRHGFDTNVRGTKALFESARKMGVPRQIFISSYSARPGAASLYAVTKHTLEAHFLQEGEAVVRPGLVVGYGGLFGRSMRRILTTPVLPILDGGRDLVPLVAISDFVRAMRRLAELSAGGAFNLFEQELVPMRQLIESLNRKARHHCWLIPVPSWAAVRLLTLVGALGVALPVDVGSLRALKANQIPLHRSTLREVLGQEAGLDTMLDAALAQYRQPSRI